MIDIEMTPVENSRAVLASILVSFKDVVPCELDLLFGQAIKDAEHDDSRHADSQGYSLEHTRLGM